MPALDGLRGIAVLVVVFHNAGSAQVHADSRFMKALFYTHAYGWVGVQLFFALSGFLITGALLDAREPTPGAALRRFWSRRALRIFPLYYAVVLPLSVVTISHTGFVGDFGSPADLWWYWTYLSNWGQPCGHLISVLAHFWSLSVEEQFYATWPLLVLFCRPRVVLRVSIVLVFVSLLLRIGLCSRGLSEMVYENTFTRMDALALGASAAVVARDARALRRVAPLLGRTIVGSLALLLAMVPFTRAFNGDNPAVQTAGYLFLSLLSAALVLWGVVHEGAPRARWLEAPWLRWSANTATGFTSFTFPSRSCSRVAWGRRSTDRPPFPRSSRGRSTRRWYSPSLWERRCSRGASWSSRRSRGASACGQASRRLRSVKRRPARRESSMLRDSNTVSADHRWDGGFERELAL